MADEKLFETEKHCFELFIFHGHLLCTLYYSKLIPQKGKYQIQDGFRVICQLFALTMAESCFNHIPFDVWIKLNQSTYIKLYQVGSLGFFGQITSIIFPSGAKIGGGYGHPMAGVVHGPLLPPILRRSQRQLLWISNIPCIYIYTCIWYADIKWYNV